MKLFIATFALALGLALGDGLTCYSSTDTTSKECTSKCYGPALKLSGYDGDVSGCAATCPNDYDGTCVLCETNDCNKMATLEDKYKCYTYTYDAEAKTLSAPDKAKFQQCKIKKDDSETKMTCIAMVAGQNDETYKSGGCGKCPDNTEKTCKQCEGDFCVSSAVKVTFNLVALLAIVKALF